MEAYSSRSRSNRITRRRFLAGTAGILAGSLVAACGSRPGLAPTPTGRARELGPATIRFVTNHTAEEAKDFQHVISEFNKRYPQIRVNYLNMAGGQEFYTAIKTQAVAHNLPDVWYTRTFDIPSNAAKGWQIPLDSYVQQDAAEVNTNDFWPAEVAQMTYEGKLYALPYDFSNWAIYYNKTMFEQEGVKPPTDEWTWQDLFAVAEHFVRRKGNRQERWGLNAGFWDWFFMGVLVANGGKVFSDDLRRCELNSEQNVETFRMFWRQMQKGVIPLPGATPQGVDPFAGGLVAMNVNGSWATQSTRDAVGDRFEWDVVKLPKGSTGKRGVSAAGGAWGIAENSKYKEQAWEFVKFLASKDSINYLISRITRSIPGRQSCAQEWERVVRSSHQPPAHIEVFVSQMKEDAINWTYPPYWAEFQTIWANRTQAITNGQDPAKVLPQLEAEVNAVARRYFKA